MRGGGGGMDIFDLLGGRGRGQQSSGKKKGQSVTMELPITLEEIMNGSTRKLAINRKRLCVTCHGKGGEGVSECNKCKGKGQYMKVVQLGPGMISQSAAVCDKCGGEGMIIPEGKRCKTCKGKKVCAERKVLEVHVDRGVTDKHKYLFKEESDE